MSEKEKKITPEKKATPVAAKEALSGKPVVETVVEPYVYGVQPFLTVIMIKDNKYSFRFEMPFNIPYDTCVEACEEILTAVKKLRDDSMKKKEEMDKASLVKANLDKEAAKDTSVKSVEAAKKEKEEEIIKK